jgi:hypothetical protein
LIVEWTKVGSVAVADEATACVVADSAGTDPGERETPVRRVAAIPDAAQARSATAIADAIAAVARVSDRSASSVGDDELGDLTAVADERGSAQVGRAPLVQRWELLADTT